MSSPVLPTITSKQTAIAGEPRPSLLQSKSRGKKETKLFTPHPPKNPPNPTSSKRNKLLRVRREADNSYPYPTREELDGTNRRISKKLQKLQILEERNRQRYNEVKRAGKLVVLAPTSQDDISTAVFMTESNLGSGMTSFLEPIEEKVDPETISVGASNHPPSWSGETDVDSGSMATTLKTLETSSFTVYEGVDPDKIQYTPEEMRCNDLMIKMEGQALEEVKEEAVNAHSKALLTRADLTDSVRDVEKELKTLTSDLKSVHQTNTSMVAIVRTADGVLKNAQRKKQAVHLKKTMQKEEQTLEELHEEQHTPETTNVSTQTFDLNPQYMVEYLGEEIMANGQRPETYYVPPSRRLKRKPSPLSMHSLRAPQSGSGNMVDQQNMSNYLVSEQKKVKCELLSKLNLYVDILETMAEANYKRPEKERLLERVQRFLPLLTEYEVAPKIRAETADQQGEASQKTAAFDAGNNNFSEGTATATTACDAIVQDTTAAELESDTTHYTAVSVAEEKIDLNTVILQPDCTPTLDTEAVASDIDATQVTTFVLDSGAAKDSVLSVIQDTATDLDSKAEIQEKETELENRAAQDTEMGECPSEIIHDTPAALDSEATQDTEMDDIKNEGIKSAAAADLYRKASKMANEVILNLLADLDSKAAEGSAVLDKASDLAVHAQETENGDINEQNKAANLISEASKDTNVIEPTAVDDPQDTENGDTTHEVIAQDVETNEVIEATVDLYNKAAQDTETCDAVSDGFQDKEKSVDLDSEALQDTEMNEPEDKVIAAGLEAPHDTEIDAKREVFQDTAGNQESEAAQDTETKGSEDKNNAATETKDIETAVVIEDNEADVNGKVAQDIEMRDAEKEVVQDIAANTNSDAPQNSHMVDTANTFIQADLDGATAQTETGKTADEVIQDKVSGLDNDSEAAQDMECGDEAVHEIETNLDSQGAQDTEMGDEVTQTNIESEAIQKTDTDTQDEVSDLNQESAQDVECGSKTTLDTHCAHDADEVIETNHTQGAQVIEMEDGEKEATRDTTLILGSEAAKNTDTCIPEKLDSEAAQNMECSDEIIDSNLDTQGAQDTEMENIEKESIQDVTPSLEGEAAQNRDTANSAIQDKVSNHSEAPQDTETSDTANEVIQDTGAGLDRETAQGTEAREYKDKGLQDTASTYLDSKPVQDTEIGHSENEEIEADLDSKYILDTAADLDGKSAQDTETDDANINPVHDTDDKERNVAQAIVTDDSRNESTQDITVAVSDNVAVQDIAMSNPENKDTDPDTTILQETLSAVAEIDDLQDRAMATVTSGNIKDQVNQDRTAGPDNEATQGTASDDKITKTAGAYCEAAQSTLLNDTENNATTPAEPDIQAISDGTVKDAIQDNSFEGIEKTESANATPDTEIENEAVKDTANSENEGVEDTDIEIEDGESVEPSRVSSSLNKIVAQDGTAGTENEVAQDTTRSAANPLLQDTTSDAAVKTTPPVISSTPQIKANTTRVSQPTRVFRKFSQALTKSHTSSGLKQVSSFLLPKKSVSKSLPTFKKQTSEKQDEGLYKNTQVPVPADNNNAVTRIRSEERATTNSNAGTKKPRRMSVF